MVNLKSLLLLATAITAAAIKAQLTTDSTTIIQDIRNIDAGVQALTSDIKTYTTSTALLSSIPLALDIAAIHLANRKGFVDANLASAQDSANSNAIVDFTFASVGVDIPQSVLVLRSKKAAFVAAGMQAVILDGLRLLKDDHDTFSAALLAKTSPDTLARGREVVAIIDVALQGGIDDFSS